MTAAVFSRARAARPLVWLAMPLMALANQYLAVRTAQVLAGRPFGLDWLAAAIRAPWVQAWIGCEIVTLAIWMVVLSNLTLSAAFPMTALGYVLVIGMGWTLFSEPVTLAEIVGGVAILAGVWMLGDGEAKS
ncbi:MAG: transporter [Phenylobacterium sp.]|nr:transporter [Phenylobacterium sp.]